MRRKALTTGTPPKLPDGRGTLGPMPILRDDLSARLVHLTRGTTLEAATAFMAIVQERRLLGGDTDIRGGHRCVCFSEAPIGKLAHLLADPSVESMRYKPFGVMVDKVWLFAQGSRPVIYQPEAEYALLHESQQWRHVRYEPPDPKKDHTWRGSGGYGSTSYRSTRPP